MKKALFYALIVFFGCTLLFSGYKLWGILREYGRADELRQELTQYKPSLPSGTGAPVTPPAAETPDAPDAPAVVNPELAAAQALYPDTVGWITVDDTRIDYMILQTTDNAYYLNHDVKGGALASGSIFMDYRCDRSFAGFNSVVYGHQMNNGSMFDDLRRYRDRSFFDGHLSGTLYTPTSTEHFEVLAFLIVPATDRVYDIALSSEEEIGAHMAYLRENAMWFRDTVGVGAGDRLLTLSTCTYEFDDARAVLVAKLSGS